MLDGHGDDLSSYPGQIDWNFSSNVPPGGPSPGIAAQLLTGWSAVGHYPDPSSRRLGRKIAAHHNIEVDSVMVTAGTTEAIHLLGSLFRNRRGATALPTFSEYQDALRINNAQLNTVEWHRNIRRYSSSGSPANAATDPSLSLSIAPTDLDGWRRQLHGYAPDIFFLCNPNNPTGDLLELEQIEPLLNEFRSTLWVVDEAYLEFVPGTRSCIELLQRHANLVVLRSLTKSFAIPGIRLGYLVGQKHWIDRLNELRPPWSVGTLAEQAGEYIIEHYNDLLLADPLLIERRIELVQSIARLEGYHPFPTATHYFLVRTDRGDAGLLKQYLIDHHRILIRSAANFSGLDQHWFRVAARSADENRLLVAGLAGWQGAR